MITPPLICHAVSRGIQIAQPIVCANRLHPLYIVGAWLCDELGNMHLFEYRFDRDSYRDAMRAATRDAVQSGNLMTLAAASYLHECIRETAFYHGWI